MAHRNIATAAPLDGAEPGQTAPQTLSPRGNTRQIRPRAGDWPWTGRFSTVFSTPVENYDETSSFNAGQVVAGW